MKLRDALILSRAPLALTALSDAWTGYALAQPAALGELKWSLPALAIGLASMSSYAAGMVLNDVFDRHRDRELAPQRPLPSGRVSLLSAVLFATLLLLIAQGLAAFAGFRSLLLSLGLTAAIFSYDGLLKAYRLPGSLAMGLCRGLNVLLGASAAAELGEPASLSFALASLIYITALTWLSSYEKQTLPKASFALGGALLLLAPMVLILGLARAQAFAALPGMSPSALIAVAAVPGLALIALILWRLRGLLKEDPKTAGHKTTRWLIRGTLLLAALALSLTGRLATSALVLALAFPYILGARRLFAPPAPKRRP